MQLTMPSPPPQHFPSGQARHCFKPLLYDLSRRQTFACRMSRRLYFHFAFCTCTLPSSRAGLLNFILNAVNATNGMSTAVSLALSDYTQAQWRCSLLLVVFWGARAYFRVERPRDERCWLEPNKGQKPPYEHPRQRPADTI